MPTRGDAWFNRGVLVLVAALALTPPYYLRVENPAAGIDVELRGPLEREPTERKFACGEEQCRMRVQLSTLDPPRLEARLFVGEGHRPVDTFYLPVPRDRPADCGAGFSSEHPFLVTFGVGENDAMMPLCEKQRASVRRRYRPPSTPPAARSEIGKLIHRLTKGRDVVEQQNAALALGELGAKAAPAVPALMAALDIPGYVRKAAASALGKIGRPARRARAKLKRVLASETDPFVRSTLEAALAAIADRGRPD